MHVFDVDWICLVFCFTVHVNFTVQDECLSVYRVTRYHGDNSRLLIVSSMNMFKTVRAGCTIVKANDPLSRSKLESCTGLYFLVDLAHE